MAQTKEFSEPGRGSLHREQPHRAANVGEGERYTSLLGGLALVLAGIARRGLGGLALAALGVAFIRRGVTGYCALYQKMGVSSARSARPGVPDNLGIKVERSITINRSPEDIFGFWRDVRNLPRFMQNIERVEPQDSNHSHWVARSGKKGVSVEWDAAIINEHPNEMIAWESLPGSSVQNAGSVRFEPAPGGRGTEVKIALEYNPPGGMLGALGARLFGEAPEQQIDEDLGRLKQLLETGELATTAGQPAGVREKKVHLIP